MPSIWPIVIWPRGLSEVRRSFAPIAPMSFLPADVKDFAAAGLLTTLCPGANGTLSRRFRCAGDRPILKRFAIRFGRRRGQAILVMVVAMSLFMIGAIGLAINGAQIYAQQQMAQAAADAASAGIMSILRGTNATSTYTFATGTPRLASYVCSTTDGITPCVYARYNGFGGTSSDTVTRDSQRHRERYPYRAIVRNIPGGSCSSRTERLRDSPPCRMQHSPPRVPSR